MDRIEIGSLLRICTICILSKGILIMNKLNSWYIVIVFILGAVLGLISIIIPPLWIVDVKVDQSPVFPMVWTGIEGMSLWTLFFLFSSGIFLGVIYPKRKILLGMSTMSLLPILAFIEMSVVPNSHNIWPIEFVIYGFCTIPGIVGAYIGAFIRKKTLKRKVNVNSIVGNIVNKTMIQMMATG